MDRRTFLQAVGASAPAALPASEVAGHAGATASAEPRVLVYDDGRHAAPLYQFAPPLTPGDFTITVDQFADTGVDTLVYSAGLEGGAQLYNSRVAQTWGENVRQWTHPVWYRAGRHLEQLIDDGHDPLALLCNRAHEKGLLLLASNWLSLQGGDRKTHGGWGRQSDFVYDHAHCEVGRESDPRAAGVSARRFSLLHEDVRDERFGVFQEMLERYPTDGVELSLVDFVPMCRFDQVDQLRPLLTEWLRRLRRVADQAAAKQQRRKRIYLRIPIDRQTSTALGYDIETWINDGLVDGLVCCHGVFQHPMVQDWSLQELRKCVEGTDCRLVAGFSDLLHRQFERAATQEMTWAAAANAWDDGADAFAIVEYHWTPNGWPHTAEDLQTLRLLGHPDLLAVRNKIYHVPSRPGNDRETATWLPARQPALPAELKEDQPIKLRLKISDDLESTGGQEKVEEVRLRVRITNIEPTLNRVRVKLNGKTLPEDILSLDDLTYRLQPMGSFHPYGFVYDFDLPESLWPRQGENQVRVTLEKRDRRIQTRYDVHDVDLVIRYNRQRHLRTQPVKY